MLEELRGFNLKQGCFDGRNTNRLNQNKPIRLNVRADSHETVQ